MDLKTEYFETKKTARYVSLGELSPKTKYFWFALHGSKMLCEQLAYKFTDFDPSQHFIVAPEGLSRFYTEGFGGDVVATWMTKRDRLKEIDDFSHYLSELYRHFEMQLPQTAKKIVLGFSQGGTTMFRWLHQKEEALDYLISYSCWIPEDIRLDLGQTLLAKSKLIYTYGEQDQFLTDKRIHVIKNVMGLNKLDFKMNPYEGDHRVDRRQLKFIFENYIA